MPNQTISKLYEKFQMTTSRLKKVKDGKGIAEQEFKFDCNYDEKTDCPIPYITCVCKGSPVPTSIDGPEAGVRMRCSNEGCQMAKILMHKKCFEKLEENLLKILTKKGSARGWTDVQRRSNLWEKKGQGLVGNMLLCHCGHGMMCLDVDFYKEKELEEQRRNQLLAESKQRKKCNKKGKLPMVNYSNNGPVPPELLQVDFVPPGNKGLSRRQTSFSTSTLMYEQSDVTGGIGLTTKTMAAQIAQKGGQQSQKTSTMEKRPLALVQTPSIPVAESKQRKKCHKKGKLPMVNYSNNGPVPPELLQLDFVPPGNKGLSRRQTSFSTSTLMYKQSDVTDVTRGIGLTTKTMAAQIAQKGGQQSQKTSTMEKRPLALVQTPSIPVPTPKSESGTFYSLFDPGARSFNLGELLLGESRLPGLITQQRLFSHV